LFANLRRGSLRAKSGAKQHNPTVFFGAWEFTGARPGYIPHQPS
jgi:hypothetical protein